jgi:hypothetical protein
LPIFILILSESALLHRDAATWSSHSRHQIVDLSHSIHFDQPDVVIDAAREVVADVRKNSQPKNRNFNRLL